MSETLTARMARETVEFTEMSFEMSAVADHASELRGVLRKTGASSITMDSLADIEAKARNLADRLDQLAAQPVPLPLASMASAGEA